MKRRPYTLPAWTFLALAWLIPSHGFAANGLESAATRPTSGAPASENSRAASVEESRSKTAALPWTQVTIDALGSVGSMLDVVTTDEEPGAFLPPVPAVPHVSYYDATNADLKYATWDANGAWVTESVTGTPVDDGNLSSIVIGDGGIVRIFAHDQTNATWRSYTKLGTIWSDAPVAVSGNPGEFGMSGDAGFNPVLDAYVLAYSLTSTTGMGFATSSSPGYAIDTLEAGATVHDVGLHMDSTGTAHMVFVNADSFHLKYATRDHLGNYTSETVATDVACSGCGATTLTLDNDGEPHILYSRVEGSGSRLTHVWRDGGAWFSEDLNAGSSFLSYFYTAIRFDDRDNIHVLFQRADNGKLKYFTKIGSSWSGQNVANMNGNFTGRHAALLLNGSCPSVIRYDPVGADLEHEIPAGGLTYRVPTDYASIREAVDFACDGDTVLVEDGTHLESSPVDFRGKAITVRSENGPDAAILETSAANAVFMRRDLPGTQRLAGLGIRGTGGIIVEGGPPGTLPLSDLRIENCHVRGISTGPGIALYGASVHVEDCLVAGSLASGVFMFNGRSGWEAEFVNCTIVENASSFGQIRGAPSYDFRLTRCIVRGSCESTDMWLVAANVEITDCMIDSSRVTGSPTYLGTNLATDPRFCGPVSCSSAPTVAGDYTLDSGSPALAVNHPSGMLIGALGQGCIATGVEVAEGLPASRFALQRNQPNPFHRGTRISFALPHAAPANLEVYDIAGRRVRSLVSGALAAGNHSVSWDGTDDRGRPAPAGVYFYRLEAGRHTAQERMTLLR